MKNWKTKRSNVKSKKGLINRILGYLRGRLNKRMKKEEKGKPQ
jgi:ribosomal protein S17E